ncbi:MAG: AAA family ATPase [Actinomycetota bacterium]|nr:AAA family ATPase [Actinomycetota bacterium]
MAIIKLNLQQFGPFASAELDLVPGVNVILGANGTGKTFATKALYALLKGLSSEQPAGVQPREAVRAKFAGVFRPDDGDIRRLVSRVHGRNTGRLRVEFDDRGPIRFSIGSSRPVAALDFPTNADGLPEVGNAALFLPSREVLAMYEGFIAAYTNREMSFDETYYDAAVALSATALRGRRPGALRSVTEQLEYEMGGKVRLEGSRFYVHSDQRGRFEAHLVAEGVRKVASVVHLIANGALRQGGLLIWDEPEANLHPRLAEVVVDCLLSLAEGGVQVVIATHDYLMADAISRANEYREAMGRSASVRFFQIIRSEDGPAEVQPSDTFAGIEKNPLLEAFLDHHDREQQLVVQQLGGEA